MESLQPSHLRSMMESFKQRSVRSKPSRRACDRVSANSMSFDEFFSSLKEVTGQDYQRSDVEELFNEASYLQFVIICSGKDKLRSVVDIGV